MSKKIYLCTNNFYTLFGTVSNRERTVAVAVQIMAEHNLSIIFVITENGIMEITRDGSTNLKPKTQNRIKRIGE